jgi:transposase-like protein/IS1 family transposase
MRRKQVSDRECPNTGCEFYGMTSRGNIIRHGFSKVRWGRRRRYRCTACGRTSGPTTGTAYSRIQRPARAFDRVAALSVEGMSKSAIARVEGLSWNTVARWLERASRIAEQFNARRTRGFDLIELQLDEIRAFLVSRERPVWIFAAIEVWSRLWPSTIVGSRCYRNTRGLVSDVAGRSTPVDLPLITTDGFKFYAPAIQRVFGAACVLGQVIKKIRKNRVVKVGTKLILGSQWKLRDALERSEDSTKLNTSFIERLNLTIRQGSAYLNRRTPCHARSRERLVQHLELLRCHYNFMRPHGSLRFGDEVRTPAMQAGLAKRKLRFRDIFGAAAHAPPFVLVGRTRAAYPGAGKIERCAA